MNIVCISTSQIPSTTANSIEVMKVCQALAELGAFVRLLVPGRGSLPREKLVDFYGLSSGADFEIEWLPANPRLKRYDFSLSAVRRARALKADAVYAWPLQAALLALAAHIPLFLEMHEMPAGKLGPLVFRQILGSKGRKRILPITQALADALQDRFRYRFKEGEMRVAPSGVDLERYQYLPSPPEARQRLALPDVFTAGYTGHLYAGRGMGLLLDLARLHPQVQFLWVGGRPKDVETWKERLSQAGVKNVILTGFIENRRLPLYQAAAEILLMPYERSVAGSSGGNTAGICSPMKMFEYMACGRAILSSDLPVLREVLNEQNACFAQPEDLDAWSLAFSYLIEYPEERSHLARQARLDAGQYTWRERAKSSLDGFLDSSFYETDLSKPR
jgi:glycosyltransferase involved in cell wall biosynthesis